MYLLLFKWLVWKRFWWNLKSTSSTLLFLGIHKTQFDFSDSTNLQLEMRKLVGILNRMQDTQQHHPVDQRGIDAPISPELHTNLGD